MKTSGHCEQCGGLRGHSIGENYPFIVYNVGADHNPHKQWRIKKPDGSDHNYGYGTAAEAHERAAELKNKWLNPNLH